MDYGSCSLSHLNTTFVRDHMFVKISKFNPTVAGKGLSNKIADPFSFGLVLALETAQFVVIAYVQEET